MESDAPQDKILEQLELLNKKLEQQLSVKRILLTGVIYGIGFFIGSAILATIALGVLGPIVGKIPWVQESFDRGSSIMRPTQSL